MSRMIQLAIAHHNRLFRECLVRVLGDPSAIATRSVDHTLPDWLELVPQEPADVFLVDLCLPDHRAVDLVRCVRQHLSGAKVVLVACGNTEANLYECLALGVDGCVREESSLEGLREAIEKVSAGELYCSPEMVYTMFQRLAQSSRHALWKDRVDSVDLTPRELEIVHLIAERLSNKEIARKLSLSLHTVKNHVHNIVDKLQVSDRHEAVEYARRRRWLRPRDRQLTGEAR